MKIVIDEKIPFLRPALESLGYDVLCKPGVDICKEDVTDAVALFVRTRTRCDAALLDGSAVRFIGTATIGYDHIDTAYCDSRNIVWSNAAGCNAGAVLQYVQSVVYEWRESLEGLTIGVVGVGEIGSRVAAWAEGVGMRVLRNDPPKDKMGMSGLVSLDDIARECDVITFHTTLQKTGEFPSWHLAGKEFLSSLRRCALLINASRGEVVDNVALLDALSSGRVGSAAMDVWEGEPHINAALLNKAFVATPHIAGYSAEGKLNATRMVVDAFLDFAGYVGERPRFSLDAPADNVIVAASEREALLGVYSPVSDSMALKSNPLDFELLRNNYKLRREPSAYEFVLK